MPKITVVIPSKNEEKYLPLLLNDLEKQTYKGFKIIVAEASLSITSNEIYQKHNITLVDGGLPGKARNNGARHARTEFLLFLDADVSIGPDFIAQAFAKINKNKTDCISFGFTPKSKSIFLKTIHWLCKYYFLVSTRMGWPHGIGGAILVKRKIHEAIGGFDESLSGAEDQDYFKRIAPSFSYIFSLEPNVTISTRRFEEKGIISHVFKWLRIELHRIFFGEIRGSIPYF